MGENAQDGVGGEPAPQLQQHQRKGKQEADRDSRGGEVHGQQCAEGHSQERAMGQRVADDAMRRQTTKQPSRPAIEATPIPPTTARTRKSSSIGVGPGLIRAAGRPMLGRHAQHLASQIVRVIVLVRVDREAGGRTRAEQAQVLGMPLTVAGSPEQQQTCRFRQTTRSVAPMTTCKSWLTRSTPQPRSMRMRSISSYSSS